MNEYDHNIMFNYVSLTCFIQQNPDFTVYSLEVLFILQKCPDTVHSSLLASPEQASSAAPSGPDVVFSCFLLLIFKIHHQVTTVLISFEYICRYLLCYNIKFVLAVTFHRGNLFSPRVGTIG